MAFNFLNKMNEGTSHVLTGLIFLRAVWRSLFCLFSCCFLFPLQGFANSLFLEDFSSYHDGLITSEKQFWDGNNVDPKWEMTSGSLFSIQNKGWTGTPDSCMNGNMIGTPTCTNSDVFRLNSKASFSGNLRISLDLIQNKDFHGDLDAWHGVHVWLRYQSQYNLYYASINRADGNVVIKRKVPCGSDNEGTYFPLSSYVPHNWIVGQLQRYSITVEDLPDGSVKISMFDMNVSSSLPVVVGIDKGGSNPNWSSSCSTAGKYSSANYTPLNGSGHVGIRGDFANFYFDNFSVEELNSSTPVQPPIIPSTTPGLSVVQKITSSWSNGYCVNLTLKNTTNKVMNSWTLISAVNGTMTSYWSGKFSQSGNNVVITPESYNSKINPKKSVSKIGYCVNTN